MTIRQSRTGLPGQEAAGPPRGGVAGDVVLTLGPDGVVLAANPAAERLFEAPAGGLVGRDAAGLIARGGPAAAVAEERRVIGQELHDGVGQELTGLGLMAAALSRGAGRDPAADRRLAAKIAAGVTRVHHQVSVLARRLLPPAVAADGLPAALHELAARVRDLAGVRCEVAAAGAVRVADPATATHLLRIAQEAVGNALRHGRPGRIEIALRQDPGGLTLSVCDDGVGPAGAAAAGGLGLRLMRSRADRLGGTLAVRRAAGGGTVVTCVIRGEGTDASA